MANQKSLDASDSSNSENDVPSNGTKQDTSDSTDSSKTKSDVQGKNEVAKPYVRTHVRTISQVHGYPINAPPSGEPYDVLIPSTNRSPLTEPLLLDPSILDQPLEQQALQMPPKQKCYCSCGYRCDCLKLIVKHRLFSKQLIMQLRQGGLTAVSGESSETSVLPVENIHELLDQFKHLKYCKAYHSLFHENRFHQIKRKPGSLACEHHAPQESKLLFEDGNATFAVLFNGDASITNTDQVCVPIPDNEVKRRTQSLLETSSPSTTRALGTQSLSEIDVRALENLLERQNGNASLTEHSSSSSASKKRTETFENSSLRKRSTQNQKNKEQICLRTGRSNGKTSGEFERQTSCVDGVRKYLNPFLCLLNILLICVDFGSDLLIARQHFLADNYIATSITMCFIYWAAYMHFLFDAKFHRKLLLLKRYCNFPLLNCICTDLLIGVVYLLMPLKNFFESIYLVYNMYRWELRLINCRDRRRHQDIEVMLRMSLRKAHKSNLIQGLFESFPQFLYQLFFAIMSLNNDELPNPNTLHVITILSSLATYVKNSYNGDLYHIEDQLNKHFEELRHLRIVRFNYLPLKFNILLFTFNLTEFLLNFPFFLVFYKFTLYDQLFSLLGLQELYLFGLYVILFVKSYISFFKNYLTSMKLEREEDSSWKKDVLFIRRNSQSHVNYLFIARLVVSCIFLWALHPVFARRWYVLIVFFYLTLLVITFVGYVLKIAMVADQLISLRNLRMWRRIFMHLERLNGFNVYNEKLFMQWLEKILIKNYYFQWKVIIYNVCQSLFKKP